MICTHDELGSNEVLPKFCQSVHDGEHRLVVDGIQFLGSRKILTLKCNQVTVLHQYGPNTLSGDITLQNEGSGEI